MDSLVAALRRLNVCRRFNGRIIVEARALGSPALERKLESQNCHDEHVASACKAAQRIRERLMDYSMGIGIEVRTRLTADEVAMEAAKHQADMVIISRSVPSNRLAGFVPPFEARVCRLSPCPVWCAGNRPLGPRVALAVEPQTSSEQGKILNVSLIQNAAALAMSGTGPAELHLIGAWNIFDLATNWLRRRDASKSELVNCTRRSAQTELHNLAELVCRPELSIRTHLFNGAASVAVSEALTEIDPSLLVIGNRQRVGVQHALHANTVEPVLRRASCSVVSIVPDESEHWSLLSPELSQPADRVEQSSVNAVA